MAATLDLEWKKYCVCHLASDLAMISFAPVVLTNVTAVHQLSHLQCLIVGAFILDYFTFSIYL